MMGEAWWNIRRHFLQALNIDKPHQRLAPLEQSAAIQSLQGPIDMHSSQTKQFTELLLCEGCPSSKHLAQMGSWISGERASSGA